MRIDELITIQEAQEIAGVSRQTLYNWMNEGKLAYIQKGSTRFFRKEALEDAVRRSKKVNRNEDNI